MFPLSSVHCCHCRRAVAACVNDSRSSSLHFWRRLTGQLACGPIRLFITHVDDSRTVWFLRAFVCFFRTLSQKPVQVGSPNLTWKCSTMSPGNRFVLGSEAHRSRSRVTKILPSWVFALLLVLAVSSIDTEFTLSVAVTLFFAWSTRRSIYQRR